MDYRSGFGCWIVKWTMIPVNKYNIRASTIIGTKQNIVINSSNPNEKPYNKLFKDLRIIFVFKFVLLLIILH